MDTKKYYNLLNKAIRAKKPTRCVDAFMLIGLTVMLVVEFSKGNFKMDFLTFITIFIMFFSLFYKVVVESILECLDVSFDRIVKFEGEVISIEAYHYYKIGDDRGNSYVVKINGKKKRLYMYDPLVAYIKQTNKGKWASKIKKKDGMVTGAYLKYSKVLVEFHE